MNEQICTKPFPSITFLFMFHLWTKNIDNLFSYQCSKSSCGLLHGYKIRNISGPLALFGRTLTKNRKIQIHQWCGNSSRYWEKNNRMFIYWFEAFVFMFFFWIIKRKYVILQHKKYVALDKAFIGKWFCM